MVSIIVATYNYGHFIAQALRSVQEQSYENFECIIIDNGSRDNTHEAIKPLLEDNRFSYHFRDQSNVSEARNEGLGMARGNYIMFLDADDLVEKHKLKVSVQFLESHSETDLVYGDMRYFRDEQPLKLYRNYSCDENNDKPWMSYVSGSGRELARTILQGNFMVISSPVFRTVVLNETGIFDKELHYNEDWELWMRMILHQKKFMYFDAPESRTLIRLHKTSLSRDVFRMQVHGLMVLLKHQKMYNALDLKKEVAARITEHINAIRITLGKSPASEFKNRMDELRRLNLYKQVIGLTTTNTYVLKPWIKSLNLFRKLM